MRKILLALLVTIGACSTEAVRPEKLVFRPWDSLAVVWSPDSNYCVDRDTNWVYTIVKFERFERDYAHEWSKFALGSAVLVAVWFATKP